jgi:hypothetical protein
VGVYWEEGSEAGPIGQTDSEIRKLSIAQCSSAKETPSPPVTVNSHA